METQNLTSEILEENINSATKLFSESISALSKIYNKQFEVSYDIFNNFLGSAPAGKNKTVIDTDIFHSGMEVMKKNLEEFSEFSKKTMTSFMDSYFGRPAARKDGQKTMETVFHAFNLQSKQIAEINQSFLKTFSEVFTMNGEYEKLFEVFRKNTETNFRLAEEGMNEVIKSYASISGKTSADMHEMLDSFNKQIELLTESNLKIWSDMLQTLKKTGAKNEEGKKAAKRRIKINNK